MTGREVLRRGTVALRSAGIESAEFEAELLLRHALHRDRAYLYAHLPEELSPEQEQTYLELVRRRQQHRPTAYLTGVREFYGIELYVAPGVLIPRPETELLVDESIRLLRHLAPGIDPVFVDVGTGSGAVVLAVASQAPQARCFGIDRSRAALAVAGLNAKRPRLAGRVEFLHGDLLAPLPVSADVVAANLPYIPTALWETLAPEIRDHEPREALDGGADGLDVVRRLIAEAPQYLRPGGALLLEVGDGQAEPVLELLAVAFPACRRYSLPDLAGIERVVVASCGDHDLPRDALVR
jgi:release factor glutamine methyltransferase